MDITQKDNKELENPSSQIEQDAILIAAQERIKEFQDGAPDPEIIEAAEKELNNQLESKPLSEIKQKLLNEGIVAKWIMKILNGGLIRTNVFIYNMIYKKKYVLYADIKLSEEQEYRMQLITDKYAPKVMEYLKKLPDELIILGMMEWSILEQVIEKAKPRHIIPTGIVEEKK